MTTVLDRVKQGSWRAGGVRADDGQQFNSLNPGSRDVITNYRTRKHTESWPYHDWRDPCKHWAPRNSDFVLSSGNSLSHYDANNIQDALGLK